MKVTLPLGIAGIMVCISLLAVGCTDSVTQNDLQNARENVDQEVKETHDAIHDANQEIAEQQNQVEEARREVMKPVTENKLDAIQDEERELRDTIREGRNDVEKELEDTRDAKIEEEKLAAKLATQEERDAYIKSVEAKLEQADKRVDEMRQAGEDLTGPAKDENEQQIAELLDRRERTADALEKLRSKEVVEWKQSQELVDRAVQDLEIEIKESK